MPFKVVDVENYLDGLINLFDIVRIVNPNTKEVIYQNIGGDTIIHGDDCYKLWEKGKSCDKCISSKAIKEKKTFTKIEYLGDGVYIVIVSPIIFGDKLCVLEVLKDITETGVVIGLSGLNSLETNDIIYKLSKKVVKDDLTGVYNRRHINQRLPMDIDYATRHNEKLTIIMLDIDCFKEINDNYGHIIGDLALKKISSAISSKVRKDYDWVARYGGDEFLIVLKNSDEKVATKVIREIQNAVANIGLIFEDKTINITISIGSITIDPRNRDFDEIICEVDRNLKKAKEGGKNRIVTS